MYRPTENYPDPYEEFEWSEIDEEEMIEERNESEESEIETTNIDVDQPEDDQQNDEHVGNSNEVEHNQDITKNGNDDGDKNDETMEEEFDPIASAVASIMGPDGNFDIRKSPVKPIVPTSFMPRNAHPLAMPPLVPNGQHHNISASKNNSSTSLLRSFRPQHHATHSSAGNFFVYIIYVSCFVYKFDFTKKMSF